VTTAITRNMGLESIPGHPGCLISRSSRKITVPLTQRPSERHHRQAAKTLQPKQRHIMSSSRCGNLECTTSSCKRPGQLDLTQLPADGDRKYIRVVDLLAGALQLLFAHGAKTARNCRRSWPSSTNAHHSSSPELRLCAGSGAAIPKTRISVPGSQAAPRGGAESDFAALPPLPFPFSTCCVLLC
jgi:hypothetical protein